MTLDELKASTSATVSMAAVASLLDVDERTVSRACDEGDLPVMKVGRRRLIPRERLLAMLTVDLVKVK